MKAFRFSLQAVLTVRENQERKALEAFALAQAQFRKISEQRRAIQLAIEEAFKSRRELLRLSGSADQHQHLEQGLQILRSKLRQCDAELQKARAAAEGRSRELVDARKKREIIEKLETKQLAHHQAEVNRAEQKALDDLVALQTLGPLTFRLK